jgi:hypothetical protein
VAGALDEGRGTRLSWHRPARMGPAGSLAAGLARRSRWISEGCAAGSHRAGRHNQGRSLCDGPRWLEGVDRGVGCVAHGDERHQAGHNGGHAPIACDPPLQGIRAVRVGPGRGFRCCCKKGAWRRGPVVGQPLARPEGRPRSGRLCPAIGPRQGKGAAAGALAVYVHVGLAQLELEASRYTPAGKTGPAVYGASVRRGDGGACGGNGVAASRGGARRARCESPARGWVRVSARTARKSNPEGVEGGGRRSRTNPCMGVKGGCWGCKDRHPSPPPHPLTK